MTNFNGQMTEIRALLSDGTPAAALSKQMDTLASKSKSWPTIWDRYLFYQ
ncbi:hypothetical protein [Lactococcus lactis]